jgi:hypothetical protein
MAKRGLMEQDLSKLDVTTLHPLLPEVISRQATINFGKFSPALSFSVLHFLSIFHYPLIWLVVSFFSFGEEFSGGSLCNETYILVAMLFYIFQRI